MNGTSVALGIFLSTLRFSALLFGTLETIDLEAVASEATFFFFKGRLISEQIHDSIQVLNPPELKDHQYWSIRKISVVLIR